MGETHAGSVSETLFIMNPLILFIAAAIMAASLCGAVAQSIVVEFGADGGADVVTNDQDLASRDLGTFVAGVDLASSVTYGTTPPTQPDFNVGTSVTTSAGQAKVDDIGTNRDAINIFYSGLTSLNGMVVWEGLPTSTVESFATNIQSNGSGDIFTNPASGSRYLIQKEVSGAWYISNQVHTFSSNVYSGGGAATSAATLTWSEFTPYSSGSAVIGAAATPGLDGIGAVGIHFQVHGTGSGTLGVRLRHFRASLVPDGNTPPEVEITAPVDGTTLSPGTSVEFMGTATDLQDGDLSGSLSWTSSLDGSLGTGASITTSALSIGAHTIVVEASDSDSAIGSNSISVNVVMAAGNTPPVVDVTEPASGTSAIAGSSINFMATAMDNEDGDLGASLSWTSDVDGALGTGASISSSSLSVGAHSITASVDDSGALSASDAITVTITAPGNTAPGITVTSPAAGTIMSAGTPITFTATASDEEDGDLTAGITWFSDVNGPLGDGSSITTSQLSLGAHTITAAATDSSLLTGFGTIQIRVNSTVAAGGGARPNVIVIICDDAGYADFSFMDGLSGETSEVPTPSLDALAARGVTFSRAYVAANCQPTRAALVTGAYQQRIGNESVGNNLFRVDDVREGVPVTTETVWDRMKSLGYRTGAIGKWHLGQIADTPPSANSPALLGNRPQNQGIDEFYGMWHGSRNYLVGTYNRNAITDPEHPLQPRYIREAIVAPDGSKSDTIVEFSKFVDVPTAPKYITDIFGTYAVDFVKEHHDDADPFFLYVGHPAPHKPWTDESPDFDDPRINGGSRPDGGTYPTLVGSRKQVASMMITMDKQIGLLMETLEDPDGDSATDDSIVDNTLVVFINDNGGVVGKDNANGGVNGTNNGKLKGFKGSSFDGGIRVPMILAGAGLDVSKHGTVYHRPVHGVDILPTAVALGGGTLDPARDMIDGVNLMPFLNGDEDGSPHEILVHKWRGSFAVIDGEGDWKLQNSRNISAAPEFYGLYRLADGATDIDVGETNDVIGNPANADRVEEYKRHLTDHEAFFDKPRYAILSNTLETEPLNIFDHHVFRPGLHDSWSGGVNVSVDPVTGTRNWFQAGTTEEKFLFNTDSFAGAILEFPVSEIDYTANNDYRRKTGMEYMLNRIVLSGEHSSAAAHTATIGGQDIIFTNSLSGTPPQIATDATGSFTYNFGLDIILYHDLTLTGDGDATLVLNGTVSEYFTPRGLRKAGASEVSLGGSRTYSGDTAVDGGTLTLGQANAADEGSAVSIAASGATLNLTFTGTDTVDRLFIGGIQQPAGVYRADGGAGAGTGIPQITGQGTLTVISGPGVSSGYQSWSEQNAPGAPFTGDHDEDNVPNGIEYFMGESGSTFTQLPGPDASGAIVWPMSASYIGSYGDGFRIESSPDLSIWSMVPSADISIIAGDSVSYIFPSGEGIYFVRLAVDEE